MTAVRGWRRRVQARLIGLRTWQFVVIWDVAIVAGAMLGAVLGQWLLADGLDLSTLLGSGTGTLIAATITAFPARFEMQHRAKSSAGGPGDRPLLP